MRRTLIESRRCCWTSGFRALEDGRPFSRCRSERPAFGALLRAATSTRISAPRWWTPGFRPRCASPTAGPRSFASCATSSRVDASADARRRIELFGPRSVPNGVRDRHVGQLPSVAGGPQKQTAAAHVSPPDEVRRKEKAVAEDLEQNAAVLVGRNRPEKDDRGVRRQGAPKPAGRPEERTSVRGLRGRDGNPGVAKEVLPLHAGRGWHQSVARGDDVGRLGREARRVRQLPSKVQPGDERERLAQGRAFARAKPSGEIKFGRVAEKDLRPPARRAGGREEKDAGTRADYSLPVRSRTTTTMRMMPRIPLGP